MYWNQQESDQALVRYSSIIEVLGIPHLHLHFSAHEDNPVFLFDQSFEFMKQQIDEKLRQSTESSISDENDASLDPDEIPFNRKYWMVFDSSTGRLRAPRQNEFLHLLLQNPLYTKYATWLNKSEGFFKIHQPERVASLWKRVKNRQTQGTMDYETFARGIRYYYKSGVMVKTNRKHTYRFRFQINE